MVLALQAVAGFKIAMTLLQDYPLIYLDDFSYDGFSFGVAAL